MLFHLGCPCAYGLFSPHPVVTEAVKKVLDEGKHNGYGPSNGMYRAMVPLMVCVCRGMVPLMVCIGDRMGQKD